MATFDDFFNQVNGKVIEKEDASNYAQCFDLAFAWCDFLGIPRDSIRHLYAYQIFTNPNPDTSQYWDIVVNTPTGVPLQGDLVIFGTLVGVAGHVSVFKEGDTIKFTSLDQNWAGIQKAVLVNHSYNGVLGWLHPKKTVNGAVSVPKADFENLVRKSSIADRLADHFQLDNTTADFDKLIVDQFEKTLGQLSQAIKSQAIVEAERDAFRKERDQALQNACPDLSAHSGGNTGTGNTSGSGPIPDVQYSSGNNRTGISESPILTKTFWTRFIKWLLRILR